MRCTLSWPAAASWLPGYTRSQWRIAFQVWFAVGALVAIVAWKPVWEALSYGTVSPALAIVLLFLLAPVNQGAATLNAVFLVFALILGGALSLAVSAAAWAAAGYDWTDNGWAKGATFTSLGALSLGGINALRWRWELTAQFFLMTCAAFVFSGTVGSYYLPVFYWKSPLFTLANGSIAAGMTVFACWFVFPVTAAEQYRGLVAAALRALGSAVDDVQALTLAPIDPSTGLLAAATGKIDWATGDDQGLAPAVAPVRAALSKARAALLASRALHVPVKMEVDIYGGRPWRRFPSENFMHLKICIRLAVATAGTLARPLKGGRFDMRLFQHPPLRSALTNVFNDIRTTVEAVAAAVEGGATWAAADEALAGMDAAWLAYLDVALAAMCDVPAAAENSSKNEDNNCPDDDEPSEDAKATSVPSPRHADALFALRSHSAFIYLLGSRVRAIYGAAAGAVACKDTSAIPLALARMEATPGWAKSAEAFRNPEGGAAAALESLHRAAAAVDASVRKSLGASARLNSSLPAFSAVIRAGTAQGRAAPAFNVRRSTAVPSWALYGLQYGVAMAVAFTMMAIPAVARTALQERVLDLLATVAVTWMPSIGDATRRALNRTIGTAIAAAWSYAIIGLAYLASGLTWENTIPKWIVIIALMAIWSGFCALNWLRYSSVQYMWVVAALTVPLVTMPALRAPQVPWADVGWRVINVAMGVAVVWVVALTVFPLSAGSIAATAMDSALDSVAGMIRRLPTHLEAVKLENGESENDNDKELSKQAVGDIAPAWAPGTVAMRRSFFSEVNVVPVALSFRATRALGDLYVTIPALEAERLPWRRTPKAPRGAAAAAAFSVQVLLDIVDITFALKMENGPGGVWRIPATQQAWMGEVTSLVAAALENLRAAINGTDGALEALVSAVKGVDRALAAQTKAALATAEVSADKSTAAEQQLQTFISMEVAVLIYLGYYASQQLKTVAAATARAFCQKTVARSTAASAAAAELQALAERAPPKGHMGPEHAIARLLEGQHRPERAESVELAVLREATGQHRGGDRRSADVTANV